MSMGDMGKMAETFMQRTESGTVEKLQEAVAEKIGRRIDIKADQKQALKLGLVVKERSSDKLKKSGKPLTEQVKKTAAPPKTEKTEEAKKVEEGEEKSLDQELSELKETGERDAKQTRYEIARYVIDRASDESSEDAPGAIVRYLINPIGPYGKRPDEADKPLSIAANEVQRQVKTLQAKLGKDHPDVKKGEDLLKKVQEARTELMNNISTEIGSSTVGVPTSRNINYKSKIMDNLVSKNPLFKNENELKSALKELDNLSDPEKHKQWSSKYDYDQVLALFAVYGREASETMNSEASNIPPGLLNNKIKVLQNNMSLKAANRLFANEMNVVQKEFHRQNITAAPAA